VVSKTVYEHNTRFSTPDWLSLEPVEPENALRGRTLDCIGHGMYILSCGRSDISCNTFLVVTQQEPKDEHSGIILPTKGKEGNIQAC
jgi:hypothetical protein